MASEYCASHWWNGCGLSRYVKQQPDASGTDPVFNPDTAMKLKLYGLFKQAKGNEYHSMTLPSVAGPEQRIFWLSLGSSVLHVECYLSCVTVRGVTVHVRGCHGGVEGDNHKTQPGVWSVEARAKWGAWDALQGLSPAEARVS